MLHLFKSSKDVSPAIPPHQPFTDRDDVHKLHAALYNYVCRENDLLNHRTTWFLAIQSAAIFGIAYVLRINFETLYQVMSQLGEPLTATAHTDLVETLVLALPCWLLGWLCAHAANRSIRAAILAQETLGDFWDKHYPDSAENFGLPRLMGGFSLEADRRGAAFADTLVRTMWVVWALVAGAAVPLLAAVIG